MAGRDPRPAALRSGALPTGDRPLSLLRQTLRVAVLVAACSPALAAQEGEGLRLAYIDPGTGSFIVQVVIATLAGISVALGRYWSRVKGWFRRDASSEANEEPDQADD